MADPAALCGWDGPLTVGMRADPPPLGRGESGDVVSMWAGHEDVVAIWSV